MVRQGVEKKEAVEHSLDQRGHCLALVRNIDVSAVNPDAYTITTNLEISKNMEQAMQCRYGD